MQAYVEIRERRHAGRVEITLEPRIELVDEQADAVESHTVMRRRAPSLGVAPRADLTADLEVGRSLGAEGFVAIDFETATGSRASACAVGAALAANGEVRDVRRWLIHPPGNEYDGFNIGIHGITPRMTRSSPSLGEVWPELMAFVGGRALVAHYARFDMSVLRHTLTATTTEWPDLTYFCTWALARRAWPGMASYRLVDLADACGLTFEHHEPDADATATADLAIACCGHAAQRLLADASRAFGVVAGQLSCDGWTPSGEHSPRLTDLIPTVDEVPHAGPFLAKNVVFTGTLTCGLTRVSAAQLVVNAGGHATNSISKKVDYLVLGMQDAWKVNDGVHSGKMLRAAELQRAGAPIELISEDDFLRMLPG